MSTKRQNPETIALHGGDYRSDPTTKAVAVPIYRTTSYLFDSTEHAANLFGLKEFGNIYTRIMNPTNDVLEKRLAALDGGLASLTVSSGQTASTFAILNVAQAGDNIVSSTDLYGGTVSLFTHTLSKLGIEVRYADPADPKNFEKAIDDKTRAFYGETLPNPYLRVFPIKEVSDIGKKNNIPLIVDNTAAPIICKPIEHGAAVVVYSLTKYIGGHGTVVGGALIDGGNFDWTANNDGSYNCKIQVIGEGGIAESLRINTASKVNFDIFRGPEDDGGTYSSNLENILSTLKEVIYRTTGIVEKKSGFSSDSSVKLLKIKELQKITLTKTFKNYKGDVSTYGDYLNLIFATTNYPGPNFNGGSISNNKNIKFGNAYQITSGLGAATELKPELYHGYISGASVSDSKSFFSYITLAHLFTLIQHVGIFCEGDENSNEPIVYLDYNPDNTIIKSSPFQASVDPSKCF